MVIWLVDLPSASVDQHKNWKLIQFLLVLNKGNGAEARLILEGKSRNG